MSTSKPMTIVFIDLTTDVTPAAMRPGPFLPALVQAVNEQIQGPYAAEYGQQLVTFAIGDLASRQPADTAAFFRDTIPVDGALAYHTVVNGVPDIELGVDLFASLGDEGDSLSAGAGHEILELLGDPGANLWEDMGNGIMRPREECDTVQNTGYKASNGLWMTNFLLRSAWIPGAAGPWDYLGVMKSQDDYSNGYEIQAATPSTTTQVGGLAAPGAASRLGESIGHVLGRVYAVGALSSMQLARKRGHLSRTYRRGVRL